ncbi:MAG: hypothetical protein ABSF29_06995 [Tepidisphaeraceae bacterium]|jgi:aminoglycoside phosphotransferase family enzyme
MHTDCANSWLAGAFGNYQWLPQRGIYAWAGTDRLLAKICYARQDPTPTDASAAIEHARIAFLRGSRFAPSVYLRCELIPCAAGSGQFCAAAIVMRRLPDNSRLDRVCAAMGENKIGELIELLFDYQRRATETMALADTTTESSLDTGDGRIMNLIDSRLEVKGQSLKRIWEELRRSREPFMDEIRRRDRAGMCRQTHGELAADNLYIHEGVVYSLDPCVMSPDLYQLDSAFDWAHLVVTLGSIQSVIAPPALIARCASAAGISNGLMDHYAARIALIRVTMRELSRQVIHGNAAAI